MCAYVFLLTYERQLVGLAINKPASSWFCQTNFDENFKQLNKFDYTVDDKYGRGSVLLS